MKLSSCAIEETGETRLKGVVKVWKASCQIQAGRTNCIGKGDPALARTHVRLEPTLYYGQELARLIHVVDMALWLPWLDKAELSSTRESGSTGRIKSQSDEQLVAVT